MADFHTMTTPTLDRMILLCRRLGNPQNGLRYVHIAGTNGKGSVAAFLSAMLIADGVRTGTYTSPHLIRETERICCNGREIPEQELHALLGEVDMAACGMPDAPTYFERFTAAAFLYFKRCGCELVVLETGLGGAYDATNVIGAPELAVLTEIGLDHTAWLGNTVGEIAQTKCGILKKGCRGVVSACQVPEAAQVIASVAHERGVPLTIAEPLPDCGTEGLHALTRLAGDAEGVRPLRLSLAGAFQRANAALAVACARLLSVSDVAIRQGLTHAGHPGRMEVLRKNPLLLYDGAHNPDGARALAVSLREMPVCRFLYAAMRDKDVRAVLRELYRPGCSFLFFPMPDNARAMSPEELSRIAAGEGYPHVCMPTLADAIDAVTRACEPAVICGSLYLYALLPRAVHA